MQKTGFIYVWYDRWRKMYYLGCHVGSESDCYVCSSNRMRDAHRRRPQDFKRRVIQRNIPREKLLEEEHRWLSMIKDDELGKRYYNLSKRHFGHWTNNPDTRPTREKIRIANTGKKHSEEHKQKIGKANKGKRLTLEQIEHLRRINTGKKMSEETKQKIREKRAKQIITERHKQKIRESSLGRFHTEETKQKMKQKHTGKSHTDVTKEKISKAKRGVRQGKQYIWKIMGPDGKIYIENGLDVFCREHNLGAQNLGKRGKSKGFVVLEKNKQGQVI